jgi:two-component system LytT family response regulator
MTGRRLVVKSGTRMVVLQRHKIEWVEGEREYVRLHVGRESHLVRQTMNLMEQVLGNSFIRVHRSTIVNLDFVREMRPLECGDYEITMRDGRRLKLSRNHRSCLQELLQDSFRSDPFPSGEKPLAQ